jgi:CBS domain-containing protein
MTREVVTVGPGPSARQGARFMVAGQFAALPVIDGGRLVGMVAETDVLTDRLPEDPRLHLRRLDGEAAADPALLVAGVMTRRVRSVEATTAGTPRRPCWCPRASTRRW